MILTKPKEMTCVEIKAEMLRLSLLLETTTSELNSLMDEVERRVKA
jgi:hypothetical protein